jgi:hypothetical protein
MKEDKNMSHSYANRTPTVRLGYYSNGSLMTYGKYTGVQAEFKMHRDVASLWQSDRGFVLTWVSSLLIFAGGVASLTTNDPDSDFAMSKTAYNIAISATVIGSFMLVMASLKYCRSKNNISERTSLIHPNTNIITNSDV